MNRSTLATAVACCAVAQALLACGPACFDDTACADGLACLDGRCLEVTPCDRPPRTKPPCTADGGCDFPVDTWGTPTSPHPFDLVFVPEAFTGDDLESFRQRAHRLAAEMLTDPDSIIGRRPGLFRFHAVLAPSPSSDVRNADLSDTLLGGCLQVDHLVGGPLLLRADLSAAEALANGAVPGAAGTIVLFNTTYGRASALHGWHARIQMNNDGRVLTHELGHSLVGLEDEYAETDACMPSAHDPLLTGFSATNVPGETVDDLFFSANLTRDPNGAKWGGGARAGGSRYGACVFHPEDDCRMKDDADDFCRVCAAAVDRYLDHLVGVGDGPPHCGIAFDQPPDGVVDARYRFVVDDHDFPVDVTLSIDERVVVRGVSHGPGGASWSGPSTIRASMLGAGGSTVRLECRDATGEVSRASMKLTPSAR